MTVAPLARARDGSVQQRGLADARVTLEQQQMPGAPPRRFEQLVYGSQLLVALEQGFGASAFDGH